MAAPTGNENVQKYVISRIEYDTGTGFYPNEYIRVTSYHGRDCAIHFEGTLGNAIELAKSKLVYPDENLGVFYWDEEREHWHVVGIVPKPNHQG